MLLVNSTWTQQTYYQYMQKKLVLVPWLVKNELISVLSLGRSNENGITKNEEKILGSLENSISLKHV